MNTYTIIEEMVRGADFSAAPDPVQRYAEYIRNRLKAGDIPRDVEAWMQWRFDRANTRDALQQLADDIHELLGSLAREVIIRDVAITVVAHLSAIEKEEIPPINDVATRAMRDFRYWDKLLLAKPMIPYLSTRYLEELVYWHALHHAHLGWSNGDTVTLVFHEIDRLSDLCLIWLTTTTGSIRLIEECVKSGIPVFAPTETMRRNIAEAKQRFEDEATIPELSTMLMKAETGIAFLLLLKEWSDAHPDVPKEVVRRIASRYTPDIWEVDKWGLHHNVKQRKIEEIL